MNMHQKQSRKYIPNDIYGSIIQKVQQLYILNQKLLVAADQISKINHVDSHKPVPTIIYQYQTDINQSFNALIENIQEYFVALDQKLKQIAGFLELKVNNPTERQHNNGNIENLSYRIEALETNLRKTQNNEAKLIKIVQELTSRQRQEQPTMIKNGQCNYSSHSQNSFRLFSVMEKKQESSYPRPYVTDLNSSELQNSKHHQKNDGLRMCMPTINDYTVRSIGIGKKSLKGQGESQMQNTNKHHRLAYMMKVLKE